MADDRKSRQERRLLDATMGVRIWLRLQEDIFNCLKISVSICGTCGWQVKIVKILTIRQTGAARPAAASKGVIRLSYRARRVHP